jgi:hypothetical protein
VIGDVNSVKGIVSGMDGLEESLRLFSVKVKGHVEQILPVMFSIEN